MISNPWSNSFETEEQRRQREAREQMRREQQGLQVQPQGGSFGASGERMQAQQSAFGAQPQQQTPTPWANNQSGNQTPQFDNTTEILWMII